LAQADETLIVLNQSKTVSLRRIHSTLRKAGATQLLKLGCVGSITPFTLATGEMLLKLVVLKAPEGKKVDLNIPIQQGKVCLFTYFVII